MAIDWSLGQPRAWNPVGSEAIIQALARATEDKRRREEFEKELAAKQEAERTTREQALAFHRDQVAHQLAQEKHDAAIEARMQKNTDSEIEHRKSLERQGRASALLNPSIVGALGSSDPNALAPLQPGLGALGLNVKQGVDALSPDEVSGRFDQKMGDLERPEAQAIQEQGNFADAAAQSPDAAKALSFIKGLPGMGAVVPSIPKAPDPEQRRWAASTMNSFQGDRFERPIDQSKAVIADDTGAPLATFDPAANALHKAVAAQKLGASLGGIGGNLGKRAEATATALGSTGLPTDQVAKMALEAGQKRESEDEAARRAAMVQAHMDTRTGAGTERKERADARAEWAAFEKDEGVVPTVEKYRSLSEAMSKMDKSNGLVTRQVLFSLAKANDSGRLSDQDYARSVGGADVGTRIKSWLSGQVQGDLSQAEKARITGALKVYLQNTASRLKDADAKAQALRDDPAFGAASDYLRGRYDRTFGMLPWNRKKDSTAASAPAVKPKAASGGTSVSATAKGGEDPNEALRKALEAIRGGP